MRFIRSYGAIDLILLMVGLSIIFLTSTITAPVVILLTALILLINLVFHLDGKLFQKRHEIDQIRATLQRITEERDGLQAAVKMLQEQLQEPAASSSGSGPKFPLTGGQDRGAPRGREPKK